MPPLARLRQQEDWCYCMDTDRELDAADEDDSVAAAEEQYWCGCSVPASLLEENDSAGSSCSLDKAAYTSPHLSSASCNQTAASQPLQLRTNSVWKLLDDPRSSSARLMPMLATRAENKAVVWNEPR